MGDVPFDPGLYPDIARASSLRAVLQSEFDRAGHELTALVPSAPGWRYVRADVRNDHRNVDVLMGSSERVFTMQFWAQTVHMARGSTTDLRAVAGAVQVWQSGAVVRQLNAAWPFVEFWPMAEAVERGEGIEFKWQQYYAYSQPHTTMRRPHQLVPLNTFIAAAMDEPRLRALYPFTSHYTLNFRSTVGHTQSIGLQVTPVGEDRYLVRGPGKREVGKADAVGSVRLALTVLDEIEAM